MKGAVAAHPARVKALPSYFFYAEVDFSREKFLRPLLLGAQPLDTLATDVRLFPGKVFPARPLAQLPSGLIFRRAFTIEDMSCLKYAPVVASEACPRVFFARTRPVPSGLVRSTSLA